MKNINFTAKQMARLLLQIKAIKLNNEQPFTWASGKKSPIYCDNRVTLSYPEIRTFIREQFVAKINEEFSEVDVIAGVATGAIAQGVLVAQELGKPFVYVRSKAKDHGLTNQIEGELKSGQSVIVIEDLISTGQSSLAAVDALREKGAIVKGLVAIFTYGLDASINAFKEKEVRMDTICDYDTLLEEAKEENYVAEENLLSLNNWRNNPDKWSKDRGGL
jgi:orotate phosphoribosyltransferase